MIDDEIRHQLEVRGERRDVVPGAEPCVDARVIELRRHEDSDRGHVHGAPGVDKAGAVLVVEPNVGAVLFPVAINGDGVLRIGDVESVEAVEDAGRGRRIEGVGERIEVIPRGADEHVLDVHPAQPRVGLEHEGGDGKCNSSDHDHPLVGVRTNARDHRARRRSIQARSADSRIQVSGLRITIRRDSRGMRRCAIPVSETSTLYVPPSS